MFLCFSPGVIGSLSRAVAGFLAAFILTLQVHAAPSIASHPMPTSVPNGGHAVLMVSADGDDLSHQWFRGESGDDSQPVPGATGPMLLSPVMRESASFWVRVENTEGVADSDAALVAVSPLPSGRLMTTGMNSNGQLGDGSTVSRNHFEMIATGVIGAAGGTNHSMFITADGTL